MDTNTEDKRTPFGRAVDIRLAVLGRSQKWLIEQLREMTGKYVDDSLIYKLRYGQVSSAPMCAAIREILEIPEDIA